MTIFPEFERQLRELPATSPRTALRGRLVRTARAVIPLAAVVLVVVAVSAAVLLAGHRPAARDAAAQPTVRVARAELLRSFAVLRTPQAVLGSVPARVTGPLNFEQRYPIEARLGYPEADKALMRTIRLPGENGYATITPTTYRPSARSGARSEGVDLEMTQGGNGATGTGPRPTPVAAVLTHGLGLVSGTPAGGRAPAVVLVPDGVTRIVFGAGRPMPSSAPSGVTPAGLADAIVTITGSATVHRDLAALSFPIPVITSERALSGVFGIQVTVPVSWYGANGTVIRRTTTELDLFVRVSGVANPLNGLTQRFSHRLQQLRAQCRRQPSACPAASLTNPNSAAAHAYEQYRAQQALAPLAVPANNCRAPILHRPAAADDGTPSSALLAILNILRTPQTQPDRAAVSRSLGRRSLLWRAVVGDRVFVRYVRRARVVAGTSYYLVPAQYDTTTAHCIAMVQGNLHRLQGSIPAALRPGLTDLVNARLGRLAPHQGVALVTTGRMSGGRGGASVTDIQTGRTIGTSGSLRGAYLTAIVPDGVATIELQYANGERITAPVINNLIVVRIPYSVPNASPSTVIWRAPDGAVLRTIR
jgi:hypothetical protein